LEGHGGCGVVCGAGNGVRGVEVWIWSSNFLVALGRFWREREHETADLRLRRDDHTHSTRLPYRATLPAREELNIRLLIMNAFRCLRAVTRPASSASTLLRPTLTRTAAPQRYVPPLSPIPLLTHSQILPTLSTPHHLPPLFPAPHARPPIHARTTRNLLRAPQFLGNPRSRGQNLIAPRPGQHADPMRSARYVQPEPSGAEAETWVFEQD
jgi:hypothetical protein